MTLTTSAQAWPSLAFTHAAEWGVADGEQASRHISSAVEISDNSENLRYSRRHLHFTPKHAKSPHENTNPRGLVPGVRGGRPFAHTEQGRSIKVSLALKTA